MSLKKKFEKVFNSLQQWPVKVSTPQLIQDIREVAEDLHDDPIRLSNLINFIKDNSQKYSNKNLVEVFSKSLLTNFIKDRKECEEFYNNHIKNNFIYKSFYRIGNHLLENRLVFYSVESDALIALKQALDEIVEKNPHLRLLEELEKLKISTTKSAQINFNINSRLKLLLLSSLSLSQISGARAQENFNSETCAISVANSQPVLNEFIFQCPNNITLYENWKSFSEYLNIDNNFGNPLHLAARLNFPEFLAGFLKVYSDVVNVRDAELRTPLHLASGSGAKDTVNYLLMHGADINAEDKAGYTALHWAASKGNLEVVKILLSHGPAIKGAGDEGITPFTIAIGKEFYDIAQLLLDFSKAGTKINRNWYKNIEEASRYLKKNQYFEVLQALNKFLKVEPTNDEEGTNEEGKFWASMLLKRSEMNFNLNNIDQALQDVERSIELYPSRAIIAHCWRIKLLFTQKKFNSALNAIEEGLSLFPNDRLLLGNRVTALINLQRYDEAMAFATELIQRFPAEAFSYKKMGDVYFRQRDYPPFRSYRKALENYKKAFSLSREDVSYKELVQALEYLANPNNTPIYLRNHQAEFSVEEALKNKPSEVITEYFYGNSDPLSRELLMAEGELAECVYKTDDHPNMKKVRELHKQALEDFTNGRNAEAQKKMEYAIVLIPSSAMDDPCINSYLAALSADLTRGYELAQNYSNALDAFRYALYLKPSMTQEESARALKKYQRLLNLANILKPLDGVGPKRLFFAAARNDEKLLSQLIQQKMDLNSKDELGNTPLIAAVKQSALKTLKILADAGADPKMKNAAGETALHWACLKGNTEAIEILANAQADLQVADAAKKTPFEITIEKGDKLAAKMLFKKISGEELPDEIFENLYEVKKSIFSDSQSLKRLTEVITWLQTKQNVFLNKMLKQCFKDRAELQLQLKNDVAYHQDFLSYLELGDEEKELKVFVKHFSRMEWGGKVVLEAVKILDKGLQLFPDNDELLTYRIEQLSVQKKYSETITLCTELVNKGTNLALPHFYLANDCINRGDYSGLKQYIQKILLNPLLYKAVLTNKFYTQAFAELQYAEQFLTKNNLQDYLRNSRGSFARKVELSKNLAFLRVVFRPSLQPGELVNDLRDKINATEINKSAMTVYFKKKNETNTDWISRENTLKLIIKELEETNDMYYSLPLSIVYANLGTAYFELNRTSEAKEAFENAIILGASDAVVYFRYGNILFKEGNFNDAHLAFKKACEFDPKNLRFKERLNEVVQRQENYFLASNTENEAVSQQKIEVKPQGSWFFRIVAVFFAASITYYLWRRETKAREERLRRFFQKDILPVLNSLTSSFYESSWETVGIDKLKLKNKPKLSIETSRLKNKGLLSGTSKFTIDSNTLHIAIHESLNKILHPEDIFYNKDTAEFIVVVKHINLESFKDKDIKNIIDAIIIKLSENSLELANIKLESENTKRTEKFKNLLSRIKEHKDKYLNSKKIRDSLDNREKFIKEIDGYKSETEGKYDEKASLIKFKKELSELSKIKKRVIAKSTELITEINNFTEAKIAAFDEKKKNESVEKDKIAEDKKYKRNSKKSEKEVDENIKEEETKKPSATPGNIPMGYEGCCQLLIDEYKKYEKSETHNSLDIDIDRIEKVLDEADKCYKGSLFQKLCDLYEQKLLIEVGLAEYQKAASKLPQLKSAPQLKAKSVTKSESVQESKPKSELQSKPELEEGSAPEPLSQTDLSKILEGESEKLVNDEERKESKQEEDNEEKHLSTIKVEAEVLSIKNSQKIHDNSFFKKYQSSSLPNPYKAYVIADQRTKTAKHAMDVLNNILKNIEEGEFNLDIDYVDKHRVSIVKVHYGFLYNIMRLMYALGILGTEYDYIRNLVYPNQAIKIRHNILKRSYMINDETFVKFEVVEKDGISKRLQKNGQLLISAENIRGFCEAPLADLEKNGQFTTVNFWNMRNEFLLNSVSQTDRKFPIVKKFLEVGLRRFHHQLTIAELLLNQTDAIKGKFFIFIKALILGKLIREIAYSFPYTETIDKRRFLDDLLDKSKNIKKINLSDIREIKNQLSGWYKTIFSSDIVNLHLSKAEEVLKAFQVVSNEKKQLEVKIRNILDEKLLDYQDKKIVHDYAEFCISQMLIHSENLILLGNEAALLPYNKYFNNAILLSSLRMAITLIGQNLRDLPAEVRVSLLAQLEKKLPGLMQGPISRFECSRDCVGHNFLEKDAVYITEGVYFVFDEITATATLDIAKQARKFNDFLKEFLNQLQKNCQKNPDEEAKSDEMANNSSKLTMC